MFACEKHLFSCRVLAHSYSSRSVWWLDLSPDLEQLEDAATWPSANNWQVVVKEIHKKCKYNVYYMGQCSSKASKLWQYSTHCSHYIYETVIKKLVQNDHLSVQRTASDKDCWSDDHKLGVHIQHVAPPWGQLINVSQQEITSCYFWYRYSSPYQNTLFWVKILNSP